MPEYLATPQGPGPHPGLVVLHEVFGVTDWIRSVADRFAARGFIALAPDLFTGRIHPRFSPEVAQRMMPVIWAMPVDQRSSEDAVRAALKGYGRDDIDVAVGLARLNLTLDWVPAAVSDMRAAVAHLKSRPDCSGSVGSIGFCFGGRMSFELAAAEGALGAAVVFYGAGPREAGIERIACPVMGVYGALDEYVTKDVPRVERAMSRHGKTFEPHTFDRTGHAFARPGSKAYHEANAAAAWSLADAFLDKHLRPARGVH
jgi:carboxymethylenebutenolidase